MRYKPVHDGEWVSPRMSPHTYKMRCCDCGLVHLLKFKVAKLTKRMKDGYWIGKPAKGYKVTFQAFRDVRATAAIRRKK